MSTDIRELPGRDSGQAVRERLERFRKGPQPTTSFGVHPI